MGRGGELMKAKMRIPPILHDVINRSHRGKILI